jgi:hypothetical protein
LIVQRGFFLVFHTCIYWTFIRFLFLYHTAPLIFNSFQAINVSDLVCLFK